jgi:hypothetical protein
MSVTLATIADALIEFILSLLRDPEAAAEFEEDPEGTLAARGLSNATAADVCGVAPIIAERSGVVSTSATPHVAPKVVPPPAPHHDDPDPSPVVREIKTITSNLTYVDNHNTVVDQSVNQNIWADGDVTQVFDNEAVVASGEESLAAGDDATIENTVDQSTDIAAGDDVLIDSEKAVTENEDSGNTTTETETVTDTSTDTTVIDSGNTATDTTAVEESYNDTTVEYTEQNVEADADVVYDSSDVVIADSPADDNF